MGGSYSPSPKTEAKDRMTERDIQSRIMLAVSKLPGVSIFRNNVAGAWAGCVVSRSPHQIVLADPYPIHAGLFKGSADLIGWRTRLIHGTRIAQFLSIEVKTPRGHLRPEQFTWLYNVADAGGIALECRSAEEAVAALSS